MINVFHDPYRMVAINILLSALAGISLLFYRYIFPKKKVNLFLILIIISVIACISLFRNGALESGDLKIHLYRTIDFYNTLGEGHLVPSWSGGLNATYGYPLYIFNYPLPYYLISLLHFIGFSFIMSGKLFLFICFLLSGIFMYRLGEHLFKNKLAAFCSAIFYQFAPYHLMDTHFRNGIGELLIFFFFPLIWYIFLQLWEKPSTLKFITATILLTLSLYAHALFAPLIMLLLCTYGLMQTYITKKMRYVTLAVTGSIIGCFGALYILLTPFLLAKYTILSQMHAYVFLPHPWELLFSPWMDGFLFQGHRGETVYLIGYPHVFISFILLILLMQKKITLSWRSDVVFWITSLIILILLTTSSAGFLWHSLSILQAMETTQRLLLPIAFITSVLAGYFTLLFLKKKILIYMLLLFTVFSTILNWGQRRVLPNVTDQTLIQTLWSSTYNLEGHWFAISKWRNPNHLYFSQLPASHLAIISGTGTVQEISRNSTYHTYVISMQTAGSLKEATMYFPGWTIYDNTKFIPVGHDQDGVIKFFLPKGLHYVDVRYDDLPIYKLLKMVSFIIFLGMFIFIPVALLFRQKS